MNQLTLPPLSHRPALQLLIAPPDVQRAAATAFSAELAQVGPVRVLDGGNRFDVLGLNRALRRRDLPLYTGLARVQVARAFTCYQMTALLERSARGADPILVLNLLSTFADENAPLAERLRLLQIALDRLHRAASRAPVLLILHPQPEDNPFLPRIRDLADQTWTLESAPLPHQMTMF